MNNNSVKVFLPVFLSIIFISANLSAQEDTQQFSREEKAKKAGEYYLEGKELNQKGDYPAANEAFKKAQQLLSSEQPSENIPAVLPKEQPPTTALKNPVPAKEDKTEAAVVVKDTAFYLKAIEKEPKNSNFYYNLAIEYIKNNQFKLASEALFRVIELNPKDADAYYNLGVLAESYFNDKKQALNFYTKYTELAFKADDLSKVKLWIKNIKKEMKQK